MIVGLQRIVLAFADVGLAVAVQAALEGPGRDVVWDAQQAAGPLVDTPPPTSPAIAPVTGRIPTSPAVVPVTGRIPTSPAVAPVTGRLPTSPAVAPVTSRLPTSPGVAPVTGRFPALALAPPPDVVLVDVDGGGRALAGAVRAWRALDPPPALLGLVVDPRAAATATSLRLPTVAASADGAELTAAIAGAERLRFTASMSPTVARHALALPATADDAAVVAVARGVDVELVHAALRWHASDYVTAARDVRALLSAAELAQLAHQGGTLTVQAVVRAGPLDGPGAARLLWTLGSIEAVTFTPAPIDRATPARRHLAELRDHLAARAQRLTHSTFYDVLELTPLAEVPEIERAFRLLQRRFGPEATGAVDLGDHAALAAPSWDLIMRARAVLVDAAARGRYTDWLRQKSGELRTAWAIDMTAARAAAEAYARGQQALSSGDPHRALSEHATAARFHPGHPDYETGLAWARYRVEVAANRARPESARRERVVAEAAIVGSRPWPRALVTCALLCAAEGDPDSARWHLREALAVDPNSAGARTLLARIGA